MKRNTSVSSVYQPSEPALPALELTQLCTWGEPIATQLWWEKEFLVIGNGTYLDPRKMEPPPEALRDEQTGTGKEQSENPQFSD